MTGRDTSIQSSTTDLDALVDVADRMCKTSELMPLLQSIEQAGRSALNCDRATIFLYDPERDELYSKVATGTGEIRFSARLGIAGEVARTRSVIIVPDAYADSRFNPEIDKKTGYRTRNLLTMPLVTPDGEVIGVLQVLNKLDGSFGPKDEVLAGAFGALTAIAIKRQMLMEEAAEKQRLELDLNIARDIQRSLLPSSNPDLPGFDVAGWNRPAHHTGGDCFDFRRLDDGRLMFMIADATGHGTGPALIVAECRAMLRAIMASSDDLAFIAASANRLLAEDLPADRFITVCFGLLDPATATLEYVSAGHGPLLLYRAATDEVESFAADGVPMGVVADIELDRAAPIKLAPGDAFVLLTDGFIEWARPDGELYGEDRLCELIRRCHQQSGAELIQTLLQDVLRFAAGTSQLDDLTAILIKRDS